MIVLPHLGMVLRSPTSRIKLEGFPLKMEGLKSRIRKLRLTFPAGFFHRVASFMSPEEAKKLSL